MKRRIRLGNALLLAMTAIIAAGCGPREAVVATDLSQAAAAEIVDLLQDANGDCVPDMRARQEAAESGRRGNESAFSVLVPRKQLRDAQTLLGLNNLPRPVVVSPTREGANPGSLGTKDQMTAAYLIHQKQQEIEQALSEHPEFARVKVMIATGGKEGEPTFAPGRGPTPDAPRASVTIALRNRECDRDNGDDFTAIVKATVAGAVDNLDRSQVSVEFIRRRYLATHGASNNASSTGASAAMYSGSSLSRGNGLILIATGLLVAVVLLLIVVNFRLRAALKRNAARQPILGPRREDTGDER